MTTYTINKNNIDIIYDKCIRYIVDNDWKYNRLKWQLEVLKSKNETWLWGEVFEGYYKGFSTEIKPWVTEAVRTWNAISPVYELAENIASCYLKHDEAFQEMHVDAKHIEKILCY